MKNYWIKFTFIAFLSMNFLGIGSIAVGQKKIQSRQIILDKHDTTKVLSSPDKIDSTNMDSMRQGSASGMTEKKIQIAGYTENQNFHTPQMDASPIEKLVENRPLSSVESHKSEGMTTQNNNMISDATSRNLGDMVDNNIDGVPDGWFSNDPAALELIFLADGSHQLTIDCQTESVYLIKYFEANASTDYEVSLTYSGQEVDLIVEEYSAENQRLVDGIHHMFLERSPGKQFAMRFRTKNLTRRILFKIEISSIGNFILNKLDIKSLMFVKKSEF